MSNIKKIWIFNHYASTDYVDKGGRHYWIAKFLKQAGYEPTVFCCNKIHNTNKRCFENDDIINESIDDATDVLYVFLKGRDYQGNGKARALNMLDYYRNLKRIAYPYAKKHGAPDIIYASSVHPLALVAGIRIAKKFRIKCVCEIRDLWPESLIEYDMASSRNIIVKILRRLERWIYIRCDALIFTMEGAYDYIKEQGWENKIPKEKVYFINNGVDLKLFDFNREHIKIKDDDLDNGEIFKVVYTGSIRKVNDVGAIIDIAKLTEEENIKYLIWGAGDELQTLKQRAEDEAVGNIIFKGTVGKENIPYILSKADLNFAHNRASPLFKYGISFNKAFEYLASGKPIICDFPSNYNPIIQNGAGVSIESALPREVADTVTKIYIQKKEQPEIYKTYCIKARETAMKYDFSILTEKLLHIFEML